MQTAICENHPVSHSNEKIETKKAEEARTTPKENRKEGKEKRRKGSHRCKIRYRYRERIDAEASKRSGTIPFINY